MNTATSRRTVCLGALAGFSCQTIGQVGATDPESMLTPIVSTREHFDIGFDGAYRRDGIGPDEYETNGAVPGIDTDCVEDLTIFVHGYYNSPDAVPDKADGVETGLSNGGYGGRVAGFSWDSDLSFFRYGATREIAHRNGRKLAAFTRDYLTTCSSRTVRYVAHSLGATIALSALDELANSEQPVSVDSVALLGAAEEPAAVSLDGEYGSAVASGTDQLDNYRNPGDTILGLPIDLTGSDGALGRGGIQGPEPDGYTGYVVPEVSHFQYYEPDNGCLDQVASAWRG